MVFPYQKLSIQLISELHPRTKDVLARRFGLQDQEPETLEAIGQSHHITRERVRQIVEDGIAQIKEMARGQERLEAILQELAGVLGDSGHIKRQDLLVRELGAPLAGNHVIFLLHLGNQFFKHKETEYTHPFWTTKKEIVEVAPEFLNMVREYLQERKETLEFDELAKAHSACRGEKIHPRTVASLLEASKHIGQAYNGKWGLREWREVYPKGMRDKAYVVLRDTGKPLHFVDVAKYIEKLQESLPEQSALPGQGLPGQASAGQASWRKKSVLPQTVHNELIKDPRFVLVGRGTYGLEEWGYKPGTVKDVIMSILRENGKAMAKEEIVEKTLGQRQVKESTILLNLQDKTCFLREGEGYYCIGE